jgi:hypothetical protein
MSEISRISAPGGTTIFAVPFLQQQYDHEVRTTVFGVQEITCHIPPAFHENTIDSSGSLVFQTFGWLQQIPGKIGY